MMGKKALDAAKILIEETGLQGQLTPEEFLREREASLDRLFPQAELLPGAAAPAASRLACRCSTAVTALCGIACLKSPTIPICRTLGAAEQL
jgi:hypothetical protein